MAIFNELTGDPIMPPKKTYALNQILYGPPGTGKTYSTIRRAVEIVDGNASGDHALNVERFEKRERVNRKEQLAASAAVAIYENFLRDWLDIIEQPALLSLDRLQPGVLEKLKQWRSQGRRIVLATMRRSPENLRDQLVDMGLFDLLDYVVICQYGQGGIGKAEQVKSAVVDLCPDECLWIGDTEADVEAARALGCPIWAVTCGLRTPSYLESLAPDYISSDITQIDLRVMENNGGE